MMNTKNNECKIIDNENKCFMCGIERKDTQESLLGGIEVNLCNSCRRSLLKGLLKEDLEQDVNMDIVNGYKEQIEVLTLLMLHSYDEITSFDRTFDIAMDIINQQNRLISELEKALF